MCISYRGFTVLPSPKLSSFGTSLLTLFRWALWSKTRGGKARGSEWGLPDRGLKGTKIRYCVPGIAVSPELRRNCGFVDQANVRALVGNVETSVKSSHGSILLLEAVPTPTSYQQEDGLTSNTPCPRNCRVPVIAPELEMVGRLVEQEDVWLCEQQPGQRVQTVLLRPNI